MYGIYPSELIFNLITNMNKRKVNKFIPNIQVSTNLKEKFQFICEIDIGLRLERKLEMKEID